MKKLFLLILTAALLCTACAATAEPTLPTEPAVSIEPAEPIAQRTVVIAVIDTGFSSRAIPGENRMPGKNYLEETDSTEDTYGHGTAVASVIVNMVPNVKLVPLVSNAYDDGKILQVENDTFAQIIRDAVDAYHCDIINISAGLILDKTSVREAIAYAEEKDVLVVASAGNDYAEYGPGIYYPAAYETVLSVGSINPEETEISDFSQRGPWVDLYTCGEEVAIRTLSGNTRTSDGTSYSAAKISAYAARLMMRADTHLTAQDLREQILAQAQMLEDGTNYIGQE